MQRVLLSLLMFTGGFMFFDFDIPLMTSVQLESILQIGFAIVLGIVILAVILVIYSRASLRKVKKKKKQNDELDLF
jgi:hypothetical protein